MRFRLNTDLLFAHHGPHHTLKCVVRGFLRVLVEGLLGRILGCIYPLRPALLAARRALCAIADLVMDKVFFIHATFL
jgi:hypothetical protein